MYRIEHYKLFMPTTYFISGLMLSQYWCNRQKAEDKGIPLYLHMYMSLYFFDIIRLGKYS